VRDFRYPYDNPSGVTARDKGDAPVTVKSISSPADHGAELVADARDGLTSSPKHLPSKWFYDARGSQLFEDITRLPEYYLARAETEILQDNADEILASVRPFELVELGSGYSVKTKLLIDAMRRIGSGQTYIPIDISEDAVWEAARHLCTYYPWLRIDGLVGDYFSDLQNVPRRGRRLVAFLGSTIGNYEEAGRKAFLVELSNMLDPGDALLLGLDLVKAERPLLAAYNDAAGVTAEFNRNILHVLNHELNADFEPSEFDYTCAWNESRACIEMGLTATRAMTVRLETLDLEIEFHAGEILHNEVSYKFTRGTATAELGAAGLALEGWYTDRLDRFAVALARPT
jgi:L-histidine N-alpha-methyltransferase